MALSEERSEQTQQQWLSRLARERQDLSASVEAALVDQAARGQGWQDEETDEQNDLSGRSRDKTLIPPRISLQSRVMPVVHPGKVVSGAPQGHRTAVPKVEAEEKPVPAAQSSGIWARFAQRLTASFAMFGGVMRPEIEDHEPASEQEHLRALTGLQEAIPPPRAFPADPDMYSGRREGLAVDERRPAVPPQAIPEAIQDEPVKQRPTGAGRKIRLETTSMEATPVPPALPDLPIPRASVQMQEIQQTKAPGTLAVDRLAENESMTSAHLPAMPALHGFEGMTSVHLPAMEMGRTEAAPRTFAAFSGSGAFETGQGDVSVADKHVTSSCVVLVTLTANPGPVVVQYVSLQPQVGFTVHLTAPAAVRVPFNYAILAGEQA
jgi:hypothetical protein